MRVVPRLQGMNPGRITKGKKAILDAIDMLYAGRPLLASEIFASASVNEYKGSFQNLRATLCNHCPTLCVRPISATPDIECWEALCANGDEAWAHSLIRLPPQNCHLQHAGYQSSHSTPVYANVIFSEYLPSAHDTASTFDTVIPSAGTRLARIPCVRRILAVALDPHHFNYRCRTPLDSSRIWLWPRRGWATRKRPPQLWTPALDQLG
jgi:hypothetical protein